MFESGSAPVRHSYIACVEKTVLSTKSDASTKVLEIINRISCICLCSIFHYAEKYITTSAYKAELDDEMSFEIGVLVTVIEKNFDGWWLVR